MKYSFYTGEDLLRLCKQNGKPIYQIMKLCEADETDRPSEDIFAEMTENLNVMRDSMRQGLTQSKKSVGGLVGGDAKRMQQYSANAPLSGSIMAKAVAGAMAVAEVNACMGKIVAAPTAGACGILPGVLLTCSEEYGYDDIALIDGLFTAAAVGKIITINATVAGADGGCQAETGVAAAMTASALTELNGGSPEQALNAAAIAIKNILGTVCDPVAGLVEVPCVKRNAIGAANAMISADMSLAGVNSVIPFDEVIAAMRHVGRAMPEALRETARGGLAATPTGKRIAEQLYADK